MNEIKAIEAEQMKSELDQFKVGDTVKVHFKIVEGKTERVQIYEGLVIAIKFQSWQNLYGSQDFLRRRRGKGLPHPFTAHCKGRSCTTRQGKAGKALLYPRKDW